MLRLTALDRGTWVRLRCGGDDDDVEAKCSLRSLSLGGSVRSSSVSSAWVWYGSMTCVWTCLRRELVFLRRRKNRKHQDTAAIYTIHREKFDMMPTVCVCVL